MKVSTTFQRITWKRMILIAIGLGVIYWILESAVDMFVFHSGNVIEEIFTLDLHEIWTRSSLIWILIMFSFYIQRVITERERIEISLAHQAEKLEHANEELQRKNTELDQFTYFASHDLQEPLRKVTAFSDMLYQDLGDKLPERAEKDLGFILDATKRMQKLVQDLLTLSRSGRIAMKWERIPLSRCVNQAIQILELRIRESQAEITRDDLPEVCGDQTLLTQLYQNLLSNALKFKGSNLPMIRLTAERMNGQLVLGVKDNGIGIDPKYAEQIFAPFKRLHGRGEYPGTGIGLAICRNIIERHVGKIWVESEKGKGAHFKFTISEITPNKQEDSSWNNLMESPQSSCSLKMTPVIKS